MTSKNTKRALISSALAIVVCVAMLIGTTFAWFTDTASTGVNKIQAGNLDIEVEYTLDGDEWKPLDEATDLFSKGLWEPGHTEVVAFKFINAGSLALKYCISMNIVAENAGVNKAGQEYKLSEYLKVKTLSQEANYTGDITVGLAFDRELEKALGYTYTADFKDVSVFSDDLFLPAGEVGNYLIMKVYMPETVGNEANAIEPEKAASIDFGINVLATQQAYENDSYGNTYDENATYPVSDYSTLKEKFDGSGVYNVTEDVNVEDTLALTGFNALTLNATGKTISNTNDIWGGKSWSLVSARENSMLTIIGGNFEAKENDCYAVDVQDGATVTIEDGTFVGNIHAVYVQKGTANIKGGFFSVQQKYPDAAKADEFVLNCLDANRAAGTAKIIVTGGTFVNFNPADCQAEGPHTNFVADGYKVVSETQTNGEIWYTVIPA